MTKTKVICFGGGTGLPTLLSGLKKNPWLEISAVVTMFDDSGSSGELKDRFGILPPGDILKCLLALSKNEEPTREFLLRRIANPKGADHTGGNILLYGLEKVYGDLPAAINALGHILSITGQVCPVTLLKSSLGAEFEDGSKLQGETNIDSEIRNGKKLIRLFLDPEVTANPEVIDKIEGADILCIGPGSFFTSVLPNFLPLGVKSTIRDSDAKVIFISNLLTEGLGMIDHTVKNMTQIVEEYIGRGVDRVVVNTTLNHERLNAYAREKKFPASLRGIMTDPIYIKTGLWTDPSLARHDSTKLAFLISCLIYQLKESC